jgi:hypothetical protein
LVRRHRSKKVSATAVWSRSTGLPTACLGRIPPAHKFGKYSRAIVSASRHNLRFSISILVFTCAASGASICSICQEPFHCSESLGEFAARRVFHCDGLLIYRRRAARAELDWPVYVPDESTDKSRHRIISNASIWRHLPATVRHAVVSKAEYLLLLPAECRGRWRYCRGSASNGIMGRFIVAVGRTSLLARLSVC